jgi:hypothetical protein
MMVHSAQGRSVPGETEATAVVAGHTFTGAYIPARLRQAAEAQRKGYTVPIYPADVLWLVESHGALLAVLSEMFCDGPVHVGFAGNPLAIERLESRVRAVIANATGDA